MFTDLDGALKALLTEYLPPELAQAVTVSFAPPEELRAGQTEPLPAINLFLYDIRERRDLRRCDPELVRNGDAVVTVRRPPVFVDCSYLITAWQNPSTMGAANDEHHMLGEVMKVLLTFPTLPAGVLRGDLLNEELPTSTLQPGPLKSIGEFWNALGGKPKAALHYTVTLAVRVGSTQRLPTARRLDIAVDGALGRLPKPGTVYRSVRARHVVKNASSRR